MAQSQAMIGYDTLMEVSNGASPPVWSAIAEVSDISPPSETVDQIEVTHMKSPGRRKEYIPALSDGGETSFTINWIPGSDTDDLLQAWRLAGDVRNVRITFPNDVTWTFPASVTTITPTVPTNDKMTAQITLKTAGATTYGVAA